VRPELVAALDLQAAAAGKRQDGRYAACGRARHDALDLVLREGMSQGSGVRTARGVERAGAILVG
jgi:hypothetical protein